MPVLQNNKKKRLINYETTQFFFKKEIEIFYTANKWLKNKNCWSLCAMMMSLNYGDHCAKLSMQINFNIYSLKFFFGNVYLLYYVLLCVLFIVIRMLNIIPHIV